MAAALRFGDAWRSASQLEVEHVQSALPPLEFLYCKHLIKNGLQRGMIAEINGLRSSGRMSVCLQILRQATAAGEACAVVDANGVFDPVSAHSVGVRLNQLVWARCHGKADLAIRAADLLLHAGGFGVVLLDLCNISARVLNRIPLSSWYRFRRAVENTPTILLVCVESFQAKPWSSISLDLKLKGLHWIGKGPASLLRGLEIDASLRKAPQISAERLFLTSVR